MTNEQAKAIALPIVQQWAVWGWRVPTGVAFEPVYRAIREHLRKKAERERRRL